MTPNKPDPRLPHVWPPRIFAPIDDRFVGGYAVVESSIEDELQPQYREEYLSLKEHEAELQAAQAELELCKNAHYNLKLQYNVGPEMAAQVGALRRELQSLTEQLRIAWEVIESAAYNMEGYDNGCDACDNNKVIQKELNEALAAIDKFGEKK